MAGLFFILYETVRAARSKPGNQGENRHLHVEQAGGGSMILNGCADGYPESQGTVLLRLDKGRAGDPLVPPV